MSGKWANPIERHENIDLKGICGDYAFYLRKFLLSTENNWQLNLSDGHIRHKGQRSNIFNSGNATFSIGLSKFWNKSGEWNNCISSYWRLSYVRAGGGAGVHLPGLSPWMQAYDHVMVFYALECLVGAEWLRLIISLSSTFGIRVFFVYRLET